MKKIQYEAQGTSSLKRILSTLLVVTMIFVLPVESFALLDDDRNEQNTTVVELNRAMLDFIANGELDPQTFIDTDVAKYAPLATIARQVVEGCATEYDKALALHDWVAENIYYDYDLYLIMEDGVLAPADYWRSTLESFELRRGVCADYAAFYEIMCDSVGLPCAWAGGLTSELSFDRERTMASYYETSNPPHAWNIVYADGRWMIVDCTWDSRSRFVNNEYIQDPPIHYYFDCTVEVISEQHMCGEWHFRFQDFTCSLYENGKSNGTCLRLTNYSGNAEHLVIPRTICGVQTDSFYTDKRNTVTRSVRFPEGMNTIDFANFFWIESVYLPATTTEFRCYPGEEGREDIEIFYAGTQEQWNLIKGVNKLKGAKVFFNATDMTLHNYVENGGNVRYPCRSTYLYFTCTDCGKQIRKSSYNTTGHTDANGDGTCDVCGYNPDGGSTQVSFLQRIIDFFNRIIAFFKNLF